MTEGRTVVWMGGPNLIIEKTNISITQGGESKWSYGWADQT